MSEEKDLEARLAELEGDNQGASKKRDKPSPKAALAGVGVIAALGFAAYLAMPSDEQEAPMQTAQPAEFQAEGDGFGEITPFVPPPQPEPEIVQVESGVNEELRTQLEALQSQLEELRNSPAPDNSETTALEPCARPEHAISPSSRI